MSTAERVPGAPRPSWRKRVPTPLRHGVTIFLALLVIEYLVVPHLFAASKSLSLLSQVNVVYLILAFACEGASLFVYAVLTNALLRENAPPLGTTFRIDLATTAIAHVIPGGTAGSASLGYRLFTSHGVSGTDAAFAMGTQGLGSAVVLNVMLWISLVISIPFAGVHFIYVIVALFGMIAILAFSALVYLFTRGENSAVRLMQWLAHRMPRVDEERAIAAVNRIGGSFRQLGSDRHNLRVAVGWAALNWILDAACLYSFLAAFHAYVNPFELFAAWGIANVLAVIPITPGGLGFVESVAITLITSFGPTKSVSTLAVLGWRLVNFWLPIPIGAASYTSLRLGRGAGLRDRRRALTTMVAEAKSANEDPFVPQTPMVTPMIKAPLARNVDSEETETVDIEETQNIDTETIDTQTIDPRSIDTKSIDTETIDPETIDPETIDPETIDPVRSDEREDLGPTP
jgi:uncharacterized protein (TIRG00374 family)